MKNIPRITGNPFQYDGERTRLACSRKIFGRVHISNHRVVYSLSSTHVRFCALFVREQKIRYFNYMVQPLWVS